MLRVQPDRSEMLDAHLHQEKRLLPRTCVVAPQKATRYYKRVALRWSRAKLLTKLKSSGDVQRNKVDKAGDLNKLPPELRNKIYEFVVTQPRRVRLPRKRPEDRVSDWYGENKSARAECLQKFEIPALARTCKLLRRESLGVYYSVNEFTFVFSCRARNSETTSLASLRAVVDFVGEYIKMFKPKAFELRFLSALDIDFSTLERLAVCFASMHANGLKPQKEAYKRILLPSTCGAHSEAVAPLRDISAHLFVLGMLLSLQNCSCTSEATKSPRRSKRRLKMFECASDVKLQTKRLMLCKKLSRRQFLLPKLKAFLQHRGVLLSHVSWKALALSLHGY
jgi:predicted membrane protein